MSTKTTIKRIALVAAVAAAFGGLSTVAANATATGTYTATLTSGSTTLTGTGTATASATGAVGTAVNFNVLVTGSATPTASDVVTETPVLTGTATTKGTQLTVAKLSPVVGTLVNTTETATTTTGVTVATVTTTAAATATTGYTFTPDVPGTYILTFTTTAPSPETAGAAAVFTYTATSNGPTAYVSGTGTSSNVSGSAASASDIGDGAHFATVGIIGGSADTAYIVSSTGVGSLYGTATLVLNGTTHDGFTYNNSLSTTGGFAYFANTSAVFTGTQFGANGADIASFAATSSVAGTQTITITPVNGTSTPSTVTITWGATPVVSAQYSTAYIADGTTPATSNSQATSTLSYSKSATTQVANIQVTLNSAASTAILGQGLAVSVSGPGLVGLFNDATGAHVASGRALSFTAASGNFSTYSIPVWADGTSGTSTITITSGTTTIATKTVTFTGSPAKASATQNLFIAAPGAALGANPSTYLLEAGVVGNGKTDPAADSATSGTAAIVGKVVDSNGNPVAGATVELVSSNTAVITAGSCLEVTKGTYAAPGTWQCQVSGASGALSGQTATVTFEVYDPTTAAYDILATPLTFSIGNATVVSEALTTDAASYSALAPMIITVTAKDSAGNLVADQDGSSLATLVSSTQLGGTLASPTKLVNGIGKITTAYAPAVAGSFTISALDNLSVAGEAVSVTAASAGGSADTQAAAATDAANEATDAANAATDAANAAADAADAATSAAQDAGAKADAALAAVTALSAKITVLAAQIAKIVKKLKA